MLFYLNLVTVLIYMKAKCISKRGHC